MILPLFHVLIKSDADEQRQFGQDRADDSGKNGLMYMLTLLLRGKSSGSGSDDPAGIAGSFVPAPPAGNTGARSA